MPGLGLIMQRYKEHTTAKFEGLWNEYSVNRHFRFLFSRLGEVKNQDHDQENNKETTLTANALSNGTIDRRLSRDVGIQAFSIDIEETPSESTDHTTTIETISHDTCIPRRKSVLHSRMDFY